MQGTVVLYGPLHTTVTMTSDSEPSELPDFPVARGTKLTGTWTNRDGIVGMSPLGAAEIIERLTEGSKPPWPETTQFLFDGASNRVSFGTFDESTITWATVNAGGLDAWIVQSESRGVLVDTGTTQIRTTRDHAEAYFARWPEFVRAVRTTDGSAMWQVPCNVSISLSKRSHADKPCL